MATTVEIYVASGQVRGLVPLLSTYEGIQVISSDIATPELIGRQLLTKPDVMFIDDSAVPVTALWELLNQAMQAGVLAGQSACSHD